MIFILVTSRKKERKQNKEDPLNQWLNDGIGHHWILMWKKNQILVNVKEINSLRYLTLKILIYLVKNIKTSASFELITLRPVAGAVTPIYYAL